MAMFGMTDEKKAILIQQIALRPLIWKVSDDLAIFKIFTILKIYIFMNWLALIFCGKEIHFKNTFQFRKVCLNLFKLAQFVQQISLELLQVSHPNYSNVEKRWLAFEEIARFLSDEQITFTSQHNFSRLFHFYSFETISV